MNGIQGRVGKNLKIGSNQKTSEDNLAEVVAIGAAPFEESNNARTIMGSNYSQAVALPGSYNGKKKKASHSRDNSQDVDRNSRSKDWAQDKMPNIQNFTHSTENNNSMSVEQRRAQSPDILKTEGGTSNANASSNVNSSDHKEQSLQNKSFQTS
jgi:NADH:ubiquinone oxidoreductase subunit